MQSRLVQQGHSGTLKRCIVAVLSWLGIRTVKATAMDDRRTIGDEISGRNIAKGFGFAVAGAIKYVKVLQGPHLGRL